jgi:predicted GIY-YIG superfamily endonuclease
LQHADAAIRIVQIVVVVARREHECKPIIDTARHETVTLIYSSHDTEHNNAVALEAFLKAHLPKKKPRKIRPVRARATSKA